MYDKVDFHLAKSWEFKGFFLERSEIFGGQPRGRSLGEETSGTEHNNCVIWLFQINFDLFLSNYFETNHIQRLQLWSHGMAREDIP